jgi:transglutaminase-like putative cysteine protease
MKMPRRAAVLALPLLLLCTAVLPGAEPPAAALNPDLPCQAKRSNPVTYEVDFAVVITAPYHTRKLRVWLPLPPSDAAQEVTEGEIRTFPQKVKPRIETEKVFGNRFAYFEFDHPEGGQIIRHTFKIKVWELHWNIDPARVVGVKRWPAGFERYLKSDHSIRVNERLQALAGEIVPQRKGPVENLAAVMSWLDANMKYDPAKASLRGSSEYALAVKTGDCSDYHGLCAAFGRALGFPTRMTYGLHAFPKNSPAHCKLEVFLPPYGWVSFDVSETQKLVGAIRKAKELSDDDKKELIRAATSRLRRGFRDNTWFLQTKGTDYDLAPPARRRVPVVRTVHAEADGVALPDPNPSNPDKKEFAWMTIQQFTPDRAVSYPFKEWKSLRK